MAIEMTKCEKCGKYYNKAADAACPHCNSGAAKPAGATMPVGGGVTVAGVTAPVKSENATIARSSVNDSVRTTAVIKQKLGIDPVVGWLVAINGSEKGRDYKIHSDNNYVGRDDKMDIAIKGDDTISRENHAVVSYDDRDKIFYITPGDGRSIIRLNNKALLMTAELKAYDQIEIGLTKLVFIPLCGEAFSWEPETTEA